MTSNNPAPGADTIGFAVGAKGLSKFIERIFLIWKRYGFSTHKMESALNQFVESISPYDCKATFPTPAVVVKRFPHIIRKYQNMGVEFDVHGLRHIDYSYLSYVDQVDHFNQACDIFSQEEITVSGFRSPYLRRDHNLDQAIKEVGFSYSSNQPIIWDVVDLDSLEDAARKSYSRGLGFYNAWPANEKVSLPILKDSVVRIPVSLPDDEMLLDRIGKVDQELLKKSWLKILDETYHRGELFTLQLHPERIALCAGSLSAVLDEAKQRKPRVWIASLREIDEWWRTRLNPNVDISEIGNSQFSVSVDAPVGATVLVKNVDIDLLSEPWEDNYIRVDENNFTFHASRWPCIGLAPGINKKWYEFLRQQGYIVEQITSDKNYTCRFDGYDLNYGDELEIIEHIECTKYPLVRLGRWPNGYYSALSVTGDLDGLTLWDFILRFIGK
jgi:peptidoglycan/xylan/chitin deacetylase (PgdA/CDA1 family)